MTRDSKEAEKNYLRRSGSIAWERFKPFSPPGTDTIRDSVQLMHDFAVAVNALDAESSHRVLDLGTGSGWTSDWLRRLNFHVVSLDISVDMLKLGRERSAPQGQELVAGDFEALPFKDGSFDRAVCLNALHHVPNPALALREIARVLNDDGRVVFVEPGEGHAVNAPSQAAMRDFGVLEQDLEATVLMQYCIDAGFSRVAIRPLLYMTGDLEITRDELTRWRRWTGMKRPVRAARKLGRALLEIAGLKKGGLLFEDALSITTTRILMRHLQEHSVIVAHKSARASISREYRAAIALDPHAPPSWQGETLTCTLRLRNTGNLTWTAGAREGSVRVGAQVLDEGRRLVDRDYARAELPGDVEPGGEAVVRLELRAPERPAPHFKFDLVAEGILWFEQQGSNALVVDVPARD